MSSANLFSSVGVMCEWIVFPPLTWHENPDVAIAMLVVVQTIP
jgi:hypothetical protein